MLKAKPQEYNFIYNEQKITYKLVFDKYKTVRLRLTAPYFLEIKMPARIPHRYAEQSILKHIDWILSQSEQLQASDTQTILPFTKELFIFGKAFPVHSQTSACTQKEKLLFTAQNTFFNQEQVFLHALPILQNSHTAVSLTNAEIFVQCRDRRLRPQTHGLAQKNSPVFFKLVLSAALAGLSGKNCPFSYPTPHKNVLSSCLPAAFLSFLQTLFWFLQNFPKTRKREKDNPHYALHPPHGLTP